MTNEDLVLAIQAGTGARQKQLEQLYTQNAGMIEKIIRQYKGIEDPDDLRQESFFGLVKAAELWNPDRNCTFLTYAVYWVKSGINRYISESGAVIRIPEYRRDLIRHYHKTKNSYYMRFGRVPDDSEYMELLEITADQLEALKKDLAAEHVTSTNKLVGDDESTQIEDLIPADGDQIEAVIDRVQREELANVLWGCVDGLKEKQRDLIRNRYQDNFTLAECGAALGVSTERARRLEAAAMQSLRRGENLKRLQPYLNESAAYSMGLRGTGRGAFERIGSSQERAVMKLEERARINLQGFRMPVFCYSDEA